VNAAGVLEYLPERMTFKPPTLLTRHPERGAATLRCEPKGEQPEKKEPPRSAAATDVERRHEGICICIAQR